MRAEDEPPNELREAVELIKGLDPMIHEPSRLAILRILRKDGPTDFGRLHIIIGLSKGNLSNHLAKLEAAGVVCVHRHFRDKTPAATWSLTEAGANAFDRYRADMRTIERKSRPLIREPAPPMTYGWHGALLKRLLQGGMR